ncbi:glycoside hydrolase family 18 protein [Boletus edulis BED1]|uniref:Glycoside hydrolase family 18 protein n=1 Tax=Boletus edulis BED1 TaxID=1328754 RepID=A0AAD4GCI9_BOLED|nr:glycoside hydrolase family 18 protein [Boletus edulis BED1]
MLGMALAVPLLDKLAILSPGARDVLKRASPAAPRFVVYQDAWTYPLPAASQLQGYSVYALSFWLTSGAADMALGWQELTASQRASYLREYNAAGISLIVSAFGSTDAPTSSGVNPVTIANDLASWVLQYGVQGVDIDYEDFNAFDGSTGAAESWLISLTRQLRARLPQGQYILSHAPVAPWFSPNVWSGGGYLGVHKSVGSLIDWYNVQFYNQGATEYTTCSGLLKASSSIWPETALFQIAANGVSLNKLVIGKPGTAGDASNGYMSTSTLASCVAQARSNGWNAGVMVWEYPHVGSSWINAVRGHTWPLAGSIDPVTPPSTPNATASATPALPPTTSTTTSPTSSPTPSGSGNCDGVSAWVNTVIYVSGNKVTYAGDLWTANQWKQDEVPGGLSGGWTNDAKCT